MADPGRSREHGLESLSDHQGRARRPQLPHPGAPQHAAINLLDLAVAQLERDALESTWRVAERVAHQRDQAWQVRAGTKHTVRVEA